MTRFHLKNYFNELLLYSGQFALFYITMQIIIEKSAFLLNFGHLGLTAILLVQTYLLSAGKIPVRFRLYLVFMTPIFYSLFEMSEGFAYILNTAHMGFWIFAFITFLLKFVETHRRDHRFTEYAYVVLNIFNFEFLYFYFDVWKEVNDRDQLTIINIWSHLGSFLSDPTHLYIIWGGILLLSIIAISRFEISSLKDKIVALFGKYVDANIRDTIIDRGEYQSEKKELCILFSDIKSFTALCEKHDASAISSMLNTYFEFWEQIVSENNGTIDKYIGDAIMVIFGLEDSARACDDALSCALQVVENREDLNRALREKGLPEPEGFGIGCHFGELIVGDIGSSNRKNFTVVGDTVNVASRLESVSRRVDNSIIISEGTYSLLDPQLKRSFMNIGKVTLKGKEEQTTIWGERL